MTIKKSVLIIFYTFLPFMIYSQCWNLVWEDEFNGTALSSDWSFQQGGEGWGNNELQAYTDRVENLTVNNGYLNIIAREEAYNGASYTSARIRSINNGDWRYGKLEALIKTPTTQGIWPAFWMMPTDNVYGTWPSSGEIDIMEQLGHQSPISYGTAHWGISYSNKGSSGHSVTHPTGAYSDDFHLYSIEWEPGEIRWYLDGVLFHTLDETAIVPPFIWPFDRRFHFILNIAVGGNWPGSPDNTTVFPQTMEVDYVRVYQLLPDINIEGAVIIEPESSNVTYTLPNISGATYTWSVPNGANIVSGNSTHEIMVDWGNTAGDVEAVMTNACGSATKTLDIYMTPNLTSNPGFEQDLVHWFYAIYDGAEGNVTINTSDYALGQQSVCMEVTAIGPNFWNAQLSPQPISLTAGVDYKVGFWAKADANNKQISSAIINSNDYSYYAGSSFTLTDQWAYYEYSFTAPATAESLLNLDLGYEVGTFCFDEFYFGRDIPIPTGLVDFDLQNNRIEIFPDANEDLFVLKGTLSDYTIQLLNANEQVLLTFDNQQSELLIETTHLVTGIHFIKVENINTGALWVQQIVKE